MIPDSLRFKKEASKCEVATQLAIFLETHVPADSYDFILPDLLYFRDKEVLSGLRENPLWQVLESEFQALKGLIAEDWEDEEYVPLPSPKIKLEPRQPNNKSRVVGLIVWIVVPAIIGGIWGWFNPPHPHDQNRPGRKQNTDLLYRFH